VVYAELYGKVQDLQYGEEEVKIMVFDLLWEGKWVNPLEARSWFSPGGPLPWVPTVAEAMGFDAEQVLALSNGPSLVPGANHLREGVVVKPHQERSHGSCGRVCFKVVGTDYLERGK